MAFQVSPGINVSEIDLTSGIPAVSTSTGAIAGQFNWGPVEQVTSVSSETDLVNKFGSPNDNTAALFLTATSFLSYSNDLLVVRAAGTGMYSAAASANVAAVTRDNNSSNTANTLLVKNAEDYFSGVYTTGVPDSANASASFVSRYPGALGNSLKISVCSSANGFNGYNSNTAYPANGNVFTAWAYSAYFDSAPGTSVYAAARGATGDEMHIAVIDEDGLITGTRGTVLERFPFVSKALDAKNDDGSSNYYKEVLYKNSQYVYAATTIVNNDLMTSNVNLAGTNTTNWGATLAANVVYGSGNNYTVSFVNGVDGTVSGANTITAYSYLADPEKVDVSLLMVGTGDNNVATAIINTAEARKDCVALITPPLADSGSAASIKTWRESTLNETSSYAICDSGWKYMYDKYADKYRWVPLNGDIAGLCARTDNQRDPWFSPAGYQRGVVKNVVKLKFNPNKTDRDTLYKTGVNPVVSFPGEGTVLFGDKTMLARTSAFDRINVRRLFIVLEKAISRAAKASLFEFNDEFTRAQFVSLVEPFLRTVQGRRGIYDYRVVCDETNNTPDIIDRNEFVGDIYIKPAKSINFIQLNFVAVRTGVAFDEVVGKF